MQRKTKQNLTKLLIVLLICSAAFYVALHVKLQEKDPEIPDDPSEKTLDQDIIGSNEDEKTKEKDYEPFVPTEDESYEEAELNLGEFLTKDIYIDGYHINNWQLQEPFVIVGNTIMVPMTKNIKSALGLVIEFSDSKHLIKIFKGEKASGSIYEGKCACNLKYRELYWTHTYTFGDRKVSQGSAATTKDSRQLYISIEALRLYSGVGLSYYYNPVGGLYISTDPNRPAVDEYSENNTLYIEGRARYMMSVNKDLSYQDALYYEYLFRHEATVYKDCTQDLLMGIAHTESEYVQGARSKADAIGLMQCLLQYAEADGYTREMLEDPHFNIQRGASYLQGFIDYCDGDPNMGLAAYYLGPGNVYKMIKETGSYSSYYANVCKNRRDMLQLFVSQNGYSNEFYEYTLK